jgi:shikimate dehydrogenase
MTMTGAAKVAGVVGAPVSHSLSPAIHGAWIAAAGLDAAYVPFSVAEGGFERFVTGMRGGVIGGVNVTAPFKGRALEFADLADVAAQAAGAANLLLFRADGVVEARNTDGAGLLWALSRQAPRLRLAGATVVLVGAGGAARGAAAALLTAGAGELRIVNRTFQRARGLAEGLGPQAEAYPWERLAEALQDADLVVNATAPAAAGDVALPPPWREAERPVAMDMVYRPLRTPFLASAVERGLTVVDGLEMLIGQARPSFEALFGRAPPESVDARAAALAQMEAQA